ncbi:unnamed protein product (mitochondrion) [Plasmodiophora brassicae]|uniref:Uncharacterized protein n=1 Tax=Plasmodiophora brassicae TaxID=37360 RepID=A0A0G4IN19_PLABS|nr:hypothetical protein PBRA_005277 [Plasmodiophora brassicae]SPQ95337.1 unnamed protein product [Plasmodiophora brassicae]
MTATALSSAAHTLDALRAAVEWCDTVVVAAVYSGRPSVPPGAPFASAHQALTCIGQAARKFAILQVGVCAVRRDGQCRPFTIDVFPVISGASLQAAVGDRLLLSKSVFWSDAAHMADLARNGFDFNRVFRNGMNWLSTTDERLIEATLRSKRDAQESALTEKRTDIVITAPRDQKVFDITSLALKTFEFSKSASKAIAAGQPLLDEIPSHENLLTLSASDDDRLIITAGNSYLRRLVYQALQSHPLLQPQKYPTSDPRRPGVLVAVAAVGDGACGREAARLARQRQDLEDEGERQRESLQDNVGLRHVVELLATSSKPIFGDDLLELLLHFEFVVNGALPRTVADLQDELRSRWANCSLVDSTGVVRPPVRSASDSLSPDFADFAMPSASLDAGRIALQRALAIGCDLSLPQGSLSIPGTCLSLAVGQDRSGTAAVDDDARSLIVVIDGAIDNNGVPLPAPLPCLTPVCHRQSRTVFRAASPDDVPGVLADLQSANLHACAYDDELRLDASTPFAFETSKRPLALNVASSG